MIAAGSLGLIAYIVGRVDCTWYLVITYVPGTSELALAGGGALLGRKLAFVVECPPAMISWHTGPVRGRHRAIGGLARYEVVLA
ncbi:MAG: hypothetical protein Q9M45_08190 [Robiginitomaculum sp.]|nr:hypothetical protein [Robiginitomaculum sp.]